MSYAHTKDLIYILTKKELKTRYKNMKLGYFWSLGNPLAYGLIYWMVFKHVMKVQVENFPLFLVSALFPWQWFTNSINTATLTFVSNAPLIKKVKFPRNLLMLVVAAQDAIHFLAALPVVFLFMIIYGKGFSPMLLLGIPLLGLLQFTYTYSLGLLVASLNIFVRDLERLVGILITFLFYLTPIVYSVEMVPEQYRPYLTLNPVAPLILAWRSLFLHGTLEWSYIGICAAYGIVFTLIGHLVFRRLSWRFAEVL